MWYENTYWIVIDREINRYVIGCSHGLLLLLPDCLFFDRMMWRVFSGFVSVVEFLAWLWFISICWTPSSPARFIKLSSDCEWTKNNNMHSSTCILSKGWQNWQIVLYKHLNLIQIQQQIKFSASFIQSSVTWCFRNHSNLLLKEHLVILFLKNSWKLKTVVSYFC